MAHVVLFHSALGLRPGVQHFARELQKAGHSVTTPDLYDGETFEDYKAGNGKWFAIGIPAILQRAQASAQELKDDIVFAGFSNGAAVAEFLAATHPQAKGALLMHGAMPPQMLQIAAWPATAPVQLHYGNKDPFRNPENDTGLQKAVEASGATFTEFLYDTNGHLFTDPDLSEYNETLAKQLMERVLDFVNNA